MTGACLDCGARQEQIDDNIFPTCEKITGPHRLAIIAVREAASSMQWRARNTRRQLAQAENQVVHLSKTLDKERAAERELNASLDMLREASGMTPPSQYPDFTKRPEVFGPLPPWNGL